MPSYTWLQPGCKVSPFARSIFFGQNADLSSGPHCTILIQINAIILTLTHLICGFASITPLAFADGVFSVGAPAPA